MGWTYPYGASRRQIIAELTPAEVLRENGSRFRTLRHCCRGNVLYALHESVAPDGTSTRWIGVSLMQRYGDSWGYKDLSENEHPYYYNCPVSYLDEAGETSNEHAKEWRKACRENAAKKAAQTAKRPQVGETWSCHGAVCKKIRIHEVRGRRIVAVDLAGGGLYRIPKKLLGELLESRAEDAPVGITCVS